MPFQRIVFLICLFSGLLTADLFGQRNDNDRLQLNSWYKGQVTLKDGAVFEGQVNFNYLLDMVQVNINGQLRTFNHKQLLEFTVFKEEENRLVNYKSLNLPIGDQIYEVVAEDNEKAMLIATLVDTNTTYYQDWAPVYNRAGVPLGPRPVGPAQAHVVNRRAETFIIIDKEGRMEQVGTIVIARNNRGQLRSSIKRKRLVKILERYKPDIAEYLDQNKINLRNRRQLIDTFLSIMNT